MADHDPKEHTPELFSSSASTYWFVILMPVVGAGIVLDDVNDRLLAGVGNTLNKGVTATILISLAALFFFWLVMVAIRVRFHEKVAEVRSIWSRRFISYEIVKSVRILWPNPTILRIAYASAEKSSAFYFAVGMLEKKKVLRILFERCSNAKTWPSNFWN